jgi:hypothetical protein
MSTYPALVPNSISFDLGRLNTSAATTQDRVPVRFRHSQRVSGHILNIQYTGLSQADVDSLRTHYYNQSGTAGYFDIPSSIWGGLTAVDANALYRYAAPPQEEHTGLYYNASVQLRVALGAILVYILNGGGAAQPAVAPFTSFAFSGYAPFILNAGAADPNNPAATYLLYSGRARQ